MDLTRYALPIAVLGGALITAGLYVIVGAGAALVGAGGLLVALGVNGAEE